MDETTEQTRTPSFYERPGVVLDTIAVGPGVPMGVERVSNPSLGMGGAYGTWGNCCDNSALPSTVEHILGHALGGAPLNVGDFGFFYRHHVPELSAAEHEEVELQAGTRFITEAAHAAGWEPGEVEAILIGITTPVVPDYVEQIAAACRRARRQPEGERA